MASKLRFVFEEDKSHSLIARTSYEHVYKNLVVVLQPMFYFQYSYSLYIKYVYPCVMNRLLYHSTVGYSAQPYNMHMLFIYEYFKISISIHCNLLESFLFNSQKKEALDANH